MESGNTTPSKGSGWQNSTMNSSSLSRSNLDQAHMSSCPAVPPYSCGRTERGTWRCRERGSDPWRTYCWNTSAHRHIPVNYWFICDLEVWLKCSQLLRLEEERTLTLSAIFSFRKGLIIAKMPLKIRGSFMMLTALILMGNPSCEFVRDGAVRRFTLCLRILIIIEITGSHNEPWTQHRLFN